MATLDVIPFTYEMFFGHQIYNNGCLCSWESPFSVRHHSTCTHLLHTQLPVYCWPDLVHWPQSPHRRPYFLTLDSRLHIVLHIWYFRGEALKAQIQELVASKSLHLPAGIANLEVQCEGLGAQVQKPDCMIQPSSLSYCVCELGHMIWLLNVSVSSYKKWGYTCTSQFLIRIQ